MKSPTREQRTKNISRKEPCRYCDDTGYVVAQTRIDTWARPVKGTKEIKTTSAEVEEMGPCPFCERGFFEEFGDPEHQQKAPPVKPPWGEEGFWKGRDVSDLRPREVGRVLSREENAAKARELLDRITLKGLT